MNMKGMRAFSPYFRHLQTLTNTIQSAIEIMPGIDIFKYALHENEAFEIEKSYVYQLYFSKRSLAKI